MRRLYETIMEEIDPGWLVKNTGLLMEREAGQTFADYHKAASFVYDLLDDMDLGKSEILWFPADGKTVCQDKRMPLAWNASVGRLTIERSPVRFEDPVVADYSRHPFHLVKGAVSPPQAGRKVRIITEGQLFAGEDARDCLVMTEPLTKPRAPILRAALDLGAIGLVSDYLTGRYDTPDGIQWVNACTEGSHWHVQSEDRPFICFSVSPRVGDLLRRAASQGELTALAECDGTRSEGRLPLVTTLIPGRKEKELWILSHLYEPLSNDNSNGVIASIAIARAIKKLSASGAIPPMEFSLRLIFGMEMYGFAAYSDLVGHEGRAKVIGAVNTDSINVSPDARMNLYLAPPATPFFGNNLMERIVDECAGMLPFSISKIIGKGMYEDDTFLGEPSNGIPTLWPLGHAKWWHNSKQNMDMVDPVIFASSASLVGAWTASVLTLGEKTLPAALTMAATYAEKHLEEEARLILEAYENGKLRNVDSVEKEIEERMNFRRDRESAALYDFREVAESPLIEKEIRRLDETTKRISSALKKQVSSLQTPARTHKDKWFDYAASIVPSRRKIGFPKDLADIPPEQRTSLPDEMIYGPFARIFANIDGSKNMRQLIREAEWEENTIFSPGQIKKYTTGISYLATYGYLNAEFNIQYDKTDIINALREAGVNVGDLLMVHASLSSFGVIKGGVDTVIDALLECVGSTGTVLFPAFTRPYIYFENAASKGTDYRPHDATNPSLIWVGAVPAAVMKRKDAIRSKHATHSVVGIGPLAGECLSEHLESAPPACRQSPFGKLLDFNGKILYFGSGLSPSTFIHLLEDEMNLPYLGSAVCRVKDGNGTKTILVPKHLPGHRDFYRKDAENSKFFKKAVSEGLEIKESSLGLGKMHLIRAAEFYEVGKKVVEANPDILLCDDPLCGFCSRNKNM